MDYMDYIRRFFGFKHQYPTPDSFSDDRTRCEDHKCPQDLWKDGTNSGGSFFHDSEDPFFRNFSILKPLDPFNIFQQMEDMLSEFLLFRSGRMLDHPPVEDLFKDHEDHGGLHIVPFDKCFDTFLKDGHEEGSEFSAVDSFLEPKTPRDLVLKPSYRDSPSSGEHILQDIDLDGALWKDGSGHSIIKEFHEQPKPDMNWSFRKSVSIRTVRGPDGTLEEHRTVRDSSGNEVTTIHKSIGDQSYTVTLHKDHEGLKEKKEEFFNLDEKDVLQFQEKFHSIKDGNPPHTPGKDLLQGPDAGIHSAPGDPCYRSIFEKLFRF